MWCMPLVQEFEASVLCIVSGQPGRYSETLEREGGGWRGEKEEGERGYYCGSLDQTLFQAWKRWCTQILSALR